jgi:hypothetical protein
MTQSLLDRIKGLQYFRGLQDLRNILIEFLSTVTALETNSVIVGYSTRENIDVTSGTLVVGKEYIVGQQEPGDNFSNVGYVSDGVPFVATGTTPTTWTNNSTVSYYTGDIVVIYNDLDPSLVITTGAVNGQFGKTSFVITNDKFLQAKTYPVFETALATVVNDNTIEFDKVGGYFKIEVYN